LKRKNAVNTIHEALEELELVILEEQEDTAAQWVHQSLSYRTITFGIDSPY